LNRMLRSKVLAWLAVFCLASSSLAKVYFVEEFNDDPIAAKRWTMSSWKESDGLQGKFEVSHGEFFNDAKVDQGLRTTQDSKYYTASASFPSFSNEGKTLVFQFQTKNEQNIECGGSYLKIGPKISDLSKFRGDTPYSIMFGPDQCGSSTRKTHLIFSYKGKNLDRKRDIELKSDVFSHLYTLVLKPDNTYEVYIDQEKSASGSLYDDWAFLPPKKIKDPKQSKPSDWVDDKEIDDPSDTKPEDWVDEKQIPDPNASKPDDWDEEEDGEWTAPMIDNPKYKGEWKAKRIANPEYKGEWIHPEIDNPDYFDDPAVYKFDDISLVAIDLWQVKAGTIFDNILIADSKADADALAAKTWAKLKTVEKEQKEAKDKKAQEEAAKAAKASEASEKKEEEKKDDEDDDDADAATKDEL